MESKNNIHIPKIGIKRKFYKDIYLNPYLECDEEKFPEKRNLDIKNCFEDENSKKEGSIDEISVIGKYKSNQCRLIYDQEEKIPRNTVIDYQKLMELLTIDETSIENTISSEKGEWSNIKEHMFPYEFEFESRFESGNLRIVIQTGIDEFDLLLKNDINASKYAQWFYFRLKTKLSSSRKVTFNIINCEKEHLIFNNLKVLCYSKKINKWRRVGEDISYDTNKFSNDSKKYYSLSFSYTFNQENLIDTMFFSYCFPYTYTDLLNYIDNFLTRKPKNNFFRHEILSKSLAGNNIDLLVVTNLSSSFEEIALRPAIILTGRVHPGESNSSFVIQGVLDYLLSDKKEAFFLRNQYVFKIIPMLNPDGVINGNYRTSLSGKDLNRLWPDPRDNICPEILAVKEMMKKTLLSRNVYLYCDFHGHSNKYNNFMYGCPIGNLSKSEKVFPTIFSEKCDHFDINSTIYKISKKKLKTARAVMKKEFDIDYSYCSESSILGVNMGSKKNFFYTQNMYLEIGEKFAASLYEFSFPDIISSYMMKIKINTSCILNKNVIINNNLITSLNSLDITKKENKKTKTQTKVKSFSDVADLKPTFIKEKNKSTLSLGSKNMILPLIYPNNLKNKNEINNRKTPK